MTTRRYYTNSDGGTTLSSGINASATAITVNSAGSFPSSTPFTAVLEHGTANMEVVLVTAVASNTLTVTRGYDSSTAVSHSSGVAIRSEVVALDLNEASQHTSSNSGVHGVTGSVVGTTDVQTLTNKTLTSPTSSNPTATGTLTAATITASGAISTASTLGVTGASTQAAITASGAVTANGAGTGLTVANNATVGGTLAVTGADTAASYTANGNGQVTGVLNPKSYTNEAAAGTATAGLVVYLTAPTGAGYSAGVYRGNGTIWVPVHAPTDSNTTQTGFYSPGGNLDTPTSGTATWFTPATVTVPAWATKCVVTYTLNGIYDIGGTSNVSCVIKIGSASGAVSRRILGPGVANQRFHVTVVDTLAGLASGSQSVTISATFTAGSVVRLDSISFFTAQFIFLP